LPAAQKYADSWQAVRDTYSWYVIGYLTKDSLTISFCWQQNRSQFAGCKELRLHKLLSAIGCAYTKDRKKQKLPIAIPMMTAVFQRTSP